MYEEHVALLMAYAGAADARETAGTAQAAPLTTVRRLVRVLIMGVVTILPTAGGGSSTGESTGCHGAVCLTSTV